MSKFAAMTSPNREKSKKFIDVGDFADVVTYNRDKVDLKRLQQLAEKVYVGGAREIAKLVDDIWNDRRIEV